MNIVVVLDKASGLTSHDAVAGVKKAFKVRKAGHAGTLDPMATGILPVCLNEATKITGFLSDLDKDYVVTARLGESTDTYDSEGVVVKKAADFSISREEFEETADSFQGEIYQVPPMYSAIKVNGRPLYELARKGVEVERKARPVTIKTLEILAFCPPFFTLGVTCSKGTYIRSLCHDIGEALGVGAHVTALRRTRIGHFRIEEAARMEELPHKTTALLTIDSALRHLREIVLDDVSFKRAGNGNPVSFGAAESVKPEFVRLKDPGGRLFGIGKAFSDLIKIERIFNM